MVEYEKGLAIDEITTRQGGRKKPKPICLFPCSGFNIPGEAGRRASAIISECYYSDVSETLGIVELTRAFIDGQASVFKKKLSKQKVITVDGCQYQCAKEFITRFIRIEPEREIIIGLAEAEEREKEASRLTNTREEDIKRAVDLIRRCIEELIMK
jgi:uncharacterized metal-binding protein